MLVTVECRWYVLLGAVAFNRGVKQGQGNEVWEDLDLQTMGKPQAQQGWKSMTLMKEGA